MGPAAARGLTTGSTPGRTLVRMGMALGRPNSTMVIDDRRPAPGAKDYDATVDKWVPPEQHERNAGKDKPLDPTLTDMLLRDLASGQVRRVRAGGRRATFGGGGGNPYSTPTLGG